MKNLDEIPPEGIIVGVNDEDFSTIYADIEGPGNQLLDPTSAYFWRIWFWMLKYFTLQLGLHMKMASFAWSWYYLAIFHILLPKVCLYMSAMVFIRTYQPMQDIMPISWGLRVLFLCDWELDTSVWTLKDKLILLVWTLKDRTHLLSACYFVILYRSG